MAFDYDGSPVTYKRTRRTEPRFQAKIEEALGEARSVLNVGAGSGSYQSPGREVTALDTSARQLAANPVGRKLLATAEHLPFTEASFDAATAILTVHHWADRPRGLAEVRRVVRGPLAILTFDPFAPTEFWLWDYAPELRAVEERRYGRLEGLISELGGQVEVIPLDMPVDCADGLQVASFARPEDLCDSKVRGAQSSWSFLPEGVEDRVARELARDLESGQWDERYGHLRERDAIRCQLRLVVGRPS